MSQSSTASDTFNLKGKRKKKVPPPASANPLFVKWLSEWRDEALEKGWKSSHTYSKAIRTLKMFPLPLETGKDCRLLQNFGDKICKMLDEKLMEHKLNEASQESNGNACSGSRIGTSNDTNPLSTKTVGASSSRPITTQNVSALPNQDLSQSSTMTHSISDNSDDETIEPPPPKKRHSSGRTSGREYVPVINSGPYAILVTLHKFMQDPQFKGYLNKSDLVGAAQPLCHKSFMVPDAGSRYTAWSSMGNLIKKGLINKCRSPPRYSLTDAGYELAEKLVVCEATAKNCSAQSGHSSSMNNMNDSWSCPDVTVEESGDPFSPNTEESHTDQSELHSEIISQEESVSESCDDFFPGFRTASYALLVTLFKQVQKSGLESSMTESELCGQAQCLCDKTFITTSSKDLSESSAWASMENLIKKDLVTLIRKTFDNTETKEQGAICLRYSLTSTGYDLADRLIMADLTRQTEMGDNVNLSLNDSWSCGNILSSRPEKIRSSVNDAAKHNFNDEIVILEDSNSNGSSDVIVSRGKMSSVCHSISPSKSDEEFPETGSLPKSPNKNFHRSISISPDHDCFATHESEKQSSKSHHSISPSQPSSPVQKLSNFDFSFESMPNSPNQDEDCCTLVTTKEDSVVSIKSHLKATKNSLHNPSNVLEISDDDGDVKEVGVKKYGKNPWSDSDDDDLPDLNIPLSKRLLLKGKVKSSLLLKNLEPDKSSEPVNDENIVLDYVTSAGAEQNQIIHCELEDAVPKKGKKNQTKKNDKNFNECLKSVGSSSLIKPVTSIASTTTSMGNSVINEISGSSRMTRTVVTSDSVNLTPIFTFAPGTFDIILCIDNREFYGSKSNSKTLLPELMKSGVHCDLRHLHVGDLLWIARERMFDETGRSKGREIILNFIVERKRMDDLVSSMTDGRMKEQKFRMKQSGISDCIIMIEEYGSIQNFSMSEDRIRQSIANSQIIDGFKIKQCGCSQDAITYLACMTRALQKQFSNKTLHAVSAEQLKALPVRQSMYSNNHYMMTFDAFNEASVKQKDPTVYDLFAKQLIQVPQIRGDKAQAITNLYPTLTLLLRAYSLCSSDKERESMFAKVKCGKTERAMGIAVSRWMSMLYTETGSLR